MTQRFLRIWEIIGDKERGYQPIIPVSKSAWWAGVKAGRYPAPIKLSARTTVWRIEDIQRILEQSND